MAEVKQDLTERAAEQAYDVALEVYTKHQGGVLRRPRPAFLSKEMTNAIVAKVVPLIEDELNSQQDKSKAPKLDPEPVETDPVADAEYEGYVAGLKRAWHIVETLEGRPGKKMIAELLRQELRKAEGAAEE